MKKILLFTWEMAKIIAITLLVVVPIRYFLFQPFMVRGESMKPNFESGDYLIVDQISYRFREPERGDVIVFRSPQNNSQRFIKRIIGLPGEVVEITDGKIEIETVSGHLSLDESNYLPLLETQENESFILGEKEYFVLGDNRNFSYDSRRFGPITKDKIIGRALLRLWPYSSLSKITVPIY